MIDTLQSGFGIGDWEVYPQENRLKGPNRECVLEPKVMDVLVLLARRQGDVLSRQQILGFVWADVVVGDEVVSRAVSLLRTELGDDQKNPRYLKTISKRGYCLIADVILVSSNEPQQVDSVSDASASATGENPTESINRRTMRKLSFTIVTVLALAIVYFTIDKFLLDPARDVKREEIVAERVRDEMLVESNGDRSVAVLPFADMSPIGDQEYFGDGIAEQLLNELVRLEGLRVAPRTSSFSFKGTNESLSAIAEALNVLTIVEGSVRKEGDQVRITAQLINVADEKILWADTYDRKIANIFAIQEEIATKVSGALGVKLGVGGVNAFKGAGTRNIEAYEAYLQARDSRGDESRRLLERATQLDPNYAAAWSRLGLNILNTTWRSNPGETHETVERAYALVLRAVELDPESAQSIALLGLVLGIRGDLIPAEAAYLKALSLLSDGQNLYQYGNFLMRTGRSAAALEKYEQSEAVEPLLGQIDYRVYAALAQGRFADAREVLARSTNKEFWRGFELSIALNEGDSEEIKAIMAAMPPTAISTTALYAPVLNVFDSPEMVLSTLREAFADNGSLWPGKLHDIALLAAYFGDSELALQTIGEEWRNASPRRQAVWYAVMSEVRQLPGFKELVTDLNLVAYWRASGWADLCRSLGDDDFECI